MALSRSTRIVLVSLSTAVTFGLVTVFFVTLVDEPRSTTRYHLATFEGVLGLLTLAAMVSIPISVPTGLAGGALAARLVSCATSERSLLNWVCLGTTSGALLGAASITTYFALLNGVAGAGEHLLLLAILAVPAGAAAGGIVGVYCFRIVQHSQFQEK